MMLIELSRKDKMQDAEKYINLPERKCRGPIRKQEVFESLREILIISRGFHFTDKRDKIYAPMALQKTLSSAVIDLESGWSQTIRRLQNKYIQRQVTGK